MHILACGCLTIALLSAPTAGFTQTTRHVMRVGGLERSYLVHRPPRMASETPRALVLAFHGGGGDGPNMERLTGFSALADRAGFIVVYPEGISHNWYDGRTVPGSEAHRRKIDDVGFITQLLDTLAAHQAIDQKRIYATGISNGGIFSHFLASRLSARLAAIAPVSGLMPDIFATHFAPSDPVSVFQWQGTKDPLVPFDGGGVARGNRGYVLGALVSSQKWADHDGTSRAPTSGTLPDTDPRDGCHVTWERWSGGRAGTEVLLYALEGGGHTWPGARQYLPKAIVGSVCRDINATAAIWEFFAAHPRA